MRRLLLFLIPVVLFVASCGRADRTSLTSPSSASAVVAIVTVTDGIEVTSGGTGTFNAVGQSVTLPAGGPYSSIQFNWYTFRKEPAAFGTLYVLTQEYGGVPGDLSPSTPGFVGRSDKVDGGMYVFPARMTLTGGTKYWFYTDVPGSFAGSFDTDIYSGGDMYVSGYPTVPFHKAGASGRMVNGSYVPPPQGVFLDANFRLSGRS